MTESPTFYLVGHRNLWGSYGSVLIQGTALRQGDSTHAQLYDRNAPLELERTGPFVPAITVVGGKSIVVSDDCRQKMDSDCPGLKFKPVVKKRIVRLEWEDWDWDDERPEEFPTDGDPDCYILDQPHCEAASKEMGPLWEFFMERGAWVDLVQGDYSWELQPRLNVASWNGQHIFLGQAKNRDRPVLDTIVTDSGRDFLSSYDEDELLRFEECLVK